MERFFDEETGHVCHLIQHTGLVPQHLAMVLPGVLCYRRFLELSPSSCRPVFLQPRLEGSLRLSDVRTATATRNFIHDIALLLDRVSVFDLGELPMMTSSTRRLDGEKL